MTIPIPNPEGVVQLPKSVSEKNWSYQMGWGVQRSSYDSHQILGKLDLQVALNKSLS
jgi:hypothetical protein